MPGNGLPYVWHAFVGHLDGIPIEDFVKGVITFNLFLKMFPRSFFMHPQNHLHCQQDLLGRGV